MAVGDAHVFPGFLTPILTQLFFPKPPTTFLTCICRGERGKYAGKKVCLNRGSNSRPTGHESNTLTTEPPRQGLSQSDKICFLMIDDCHRNRIDSSLRANRSSDTVSVRKLAVAWKEYCEKHGVNGTSTDKCTGCLNKMNNVEPSISPLSVNKWLTDWLNGVLRRF